MKICIFVDKVFGRCESTPEGNSDFCATHNRMIRKMEEVAKREAEKRATQIERQKQKNTTVKELKDSNLWIPFSKFIRLRDSDENGICTCFTCGARHEWNSGMQAGHFIGRRHWATRYDEQNVHAQCPTCNMYQSGMQYEYGLKLDQKYGSGTAERLFQLSKQTVKWSQNYIDEMAVKYRELAKEKLSRLATIKQTI